MWGKIKPLTSSYLQTEPALNGVMADETHIILTQNCWDIAYGLLNGNKILFNLFALAHCVRAWYISHGTWTPHWCWTASGHQEDRTRSSQSRTAQWPCWQPGRACADAPYSSTSAAPEGHTSLYGLARDVCCIHPTCGTSVSGCLPGSTQGFQLSCGSGTVSR